MDTVGSGPIWGCSSDYSSGTRSASQTVSKTQEKHVPKIILEDCTKGTLEDLKSYPVHGIIDLVVDWVTESSRTVSFLAEFYGIDVNNHIDILPLENQYRDAGGMNFRKVHTDRIQTIVLVAKRGTAVHRLRNLCQRLNNTKTVLQQAQDVLKNLEEVKKEVDLAFLH